MSVVPKNQEVQCFTANIPSEGHPFLYGVATGIVATFLISFILVAIIMVKSLAETINTYER